MHERSLVSVKVKPRSTSRLSSALFIFPLFYLRDKNLRALTCFAKIASVEVNLKSIFSYISLGTRERGTFVAAREKPKQLYFLMFDCPKTPVLYVFCHNDNVKQAVKF